MKLEELGIEKRQITAYNKKHIHTVEDLAKWFPRKYRDYTEITDVVDHLNGDYCAVPATLMSITVKGTTNKFVRLSFMSRGRHQDKDKPVWINISIFARKMCGYLAGVVYPPYLKKDVILFGKLNFDPVYGYSITPEKDVGNGTGVEFEDKFEKKIYTIYPAVGGIKSQTVEKEIQSVIGMQRELVEPELRKQLNLSPYTAVLQAMHQPETMKDVETARKHLAFYDLIYFCMGLKKMDTTLTKGSDIVFKNTDLTRKFIGSLPYSLTRKEDRTNLIDKKTGILSGGQIDAINHMTMMAQKGKRLNVLLEGDVGCGKTLVAVCMMLLTHENGYQSVLMAPKTVLAKQHYDEISGYARSLGLECAYLHSGTSAADKKERKEALKKIKDGTASLVIGTHSCISKDVEFKNLGLVILDEEQQFGVDQKMALFEKALPNCHSIEMSATPIPRSLTMSIYSSKNIVRITEKPAGRLPVITDYTRDEQDAYNLVKTELDKGRQAYVVCPAIDDNEDVDIIGVDTVGAAYAKVFAPFGYKVGVVNGKMKPEEFKAVIEDFKCGNTHILVSTTVIEVGVNVPNATAIVIHQAERFGLSQLHQLRGRVGRKDHQSYCLLLTKDEDNERVDAMKNLNNGFDIAEADYQMRGPGNIIGTEQSGESAYINEVIACPELFNLARKVVATFDKTNRYGRFLNLVYKEHEMLDEEYRSKKKGSDE